MQLSWSSAVVMAAFSAWALAGPSVAPTIWLTIWWRVTLCLFLGVLLESLFFPGPPLRQARARTPCSNSWAQRLLTYKSFILSSRFLWTVPYATVIPIMAALGCRFTWLSDLELCTSSTVIFDSSPGSCLTTGFSCTAGALLIGAVLEILVSSFFSSFLLLFI